MESKTEVVRTQRGEGDKSGNGHTKTGRSADSLSLSVSTDDVRELLGAMQAMKAGDFSVRLPGDAVGLYGKISDAFNDIVAANQRMAQELERVGYTVGREGRTRQRIKFTNRAGAWGEMEGSVNTLIDDLLWPTNEVTHAIAAVAQGDLLQTVRLEVDGRPL